MKHSTSTQSSAKLFDTADRSIEKHKNKLLAYQELLIDWNKRINLISRDVSRETIGEHIRHSLLISYLEPFRESKLIVDAGTGGGLPGIPLVITQSQKSYILNDIVSKKVLAIKQMARRLALCNIQTNDCSIADIHVDKPFLLISKHAFKINDLYNYTSHLPWKAMIFYKSTDFRNELKVINKKLYISVYDLAVQNNNPFYEGKGLIVVRR